MLVGLQLWSSVLGILCCFVASFMFSVLSFWAPLRSKFYDVIGAYMLVSTLMFGLSFVVLWRLCNHVFPMRPEGKLWTTRRALLAWIDTILVCVGWFLEIGS